MKTAFEELMTGLDEVQAFLTGKRKGFKVHVPDETDVEKHRERGSGKHGLNRLE